MSPAATSLTLCLQLRVMLQPHPQPHCTCSQITAPAATLVPPTTVAATLHPQPLHLALQLLLILHAYVKLHLALQRLLIPAKHPQPHCTRSSHIPDPVPASTPALHNTLQPLAQVAHCTCSSSIPAPVPASTPAPPPAISSCHPVTHRPRLRLRL